jgi:hypothetical protein
MTWALTTPAKKLIITDSSYRKLKIIQMLVAKSVILDVVSTTNNNFFGEADTNLCNKIKFVKDIIDVEDRGIADIIVNRNNSNSKLKDMLGAVKEFYSLVYPEDSSVAELIDVELVELDAWTTAPVKHKSFVFQALHKIDFSMDLDAIEIAFKQAIKNPPSDDYCIYEHLNLALVNLLDSTK